MPTTIRPASADDAQALGQIFYEAFASLAARHDFPVEPSSPDFTAWRARWMLHHPGFHALVAENDGRVVAGNFVDERGEIAGIGPLVVESGAQDAGAGRALMQAALARQRERGAAGVRLVQTAYHYRSLALYAKLGFVVREPLSVLQGDPPRVAVDGRAVRPASGADLDPAAELCRRVHGHDRRAELRDAIDDGTALAVEHDGRLTGYATGLGYGWHAVGESDEDVQALLGAPDSSMGLGVLVPSRNAVLLSWCLAHGLRIVQQSTLMTLGRYQEPMGAWLPSISF